MSTRMLDNNFLLRWILAFTLLMHSIPVMITGSIADFGTLYLDKIGFAPFGIYIAWLIKLSHVAAAVCLVLNRYVRLAGWITLFILFMGIVMLHGREGWFVVGLGRNGAEFNVLLMVALVTVMYPNLGAKST